MERRNITASAQHDFLLREFFTLTLAGTVQRSGLYNDGTTEKDRKPFQDSLRGILEEMAVDYAECVSEEAHVANIEQLAKRLTEKHPDILADGGMRIGLAQKALNLYLKYLWCLGEISEPPHCPIDSIVLGKVPGCKNVRWTRIEEIEEYRRIIAAAKDEARFKGQSLAQWELTIYNGNS